jgi:uncharacterized protein YjdB
VAEDRSKQSLVLFKKDGTKISTGELGTNGITLTGIAAGTKVVAGDYKLAYTDGTQTSDKVDAPAFTVPEAKVTVTGVTLSQKTASMKVGDTTKLTETVAPDNATDKTVTYKSSNEAIATVAPDGTVKAVSAGTADITATTADGGFTASCAVTVVAAE